MARTSRRSRPELVGLEGRQLLNARMGGLATVRAASSAAVASVTPQAESQAIKTFRYATPEGAQVSIQVTGPGNLRGTTVDADGGLNLVYSGTNAASKIFVDVKRGTAPLRTVRNANLSIDNVTGVGGQILGSLVAPKLDLVDNGHVNLSAGIGRIQLRSMGSNTQLHLRELPQTVQPTVTNTNLATNTGGFLGTNGTTTGNVSVTTGQSVTGTGSAVVTTGTNTTGTTLAFQSPPGTTAVAAPVPNTATAPATYTSQGRTLSYSNDSDGGSTLTGISGQFTPGQNLVTTPDAVQPGPLKAPPGVVIDINQINAGLPGRVPIGDGQIFGYDVTTNALVRFNSRSGLALQSIPVGGVATATAGVGLARNGRELVVLLSRGTAVQAFDAVTGNAVGTFSAANLSAFGISNVDGIAFTGTNVVFTDANAPSSNGVNSFGVAIPIDVTASLLTGIAQPNGKAFPNDNGFEFSGGASGVAGRNGVFITGAAAFNSFTPNLNQVGYLTVTPSSGTLFETNRAVLANPNNPNNNVPFINAGPPGTARSNPFMGFGSIEMNLARVTNVINGLNVVTLYNPSTATPVGSVNLVTPDRIAGLSESFHPEIAGSALVDVQGNIQTFSAKTARGLALNDTGNLNLVKIVNAQDTAIVGNPVGHLVLINRQNVSIFTQYRSVGDRQGVVVDATRRPLGPLSLPN